MRGDTDFSGKRVLVVGASSGIGNGIAHGFHARDTPVAGFFTLNRYLRLTDGPDEVHMSQLGKQKIAEYVAMNAR